MSMCNFLHRGKQKGKEGREEFNNMLLVSLTHVSQQGPGRTIGEILPMHIQMHTLH